MKLDLKWTVPFTSGVQADADRFFFGLPIDCKKMHCTIQWLTI